MKSFGIFGYIFVFGLILATAIWWEMYRYHDCILVGHTKLYCIMSVGGK